MKLIQDRMKHFLFAHVRAVMNTNRQQRCSRLQLAAEAAPRMHRSYNYTLGFIRDSFLKDEPERADLKGQQSEPMLCRRILDSPRTGVRYRPLDAGHGVVAARHLLFDDFLHLVQPHAANIQTANTPQLTSNFHRAIKGAALVDLLDSHPHG
jgi:hypothetical protein